MAWRRPERNAFDAMCRAVCEDTPNRAGRVPSPCWRTTRVPQGAAASRYLRCRCRRFAVDFDESGGQAMGGPGSGGWNGWQAKPLVEAYQVLDVRVWKRQGRLVPGTRFFLPLAAEAGAEPPGRLVVLVDRC